MRRSGQTDFVLALIEAAWDLDAAWDHFAGAEEGDDEGKAFDEVVAAVGAVREALHGLRDSA